ncbi:hypothetical protein A2291_01150 [candidate division WOR-1 bacterium RIFOXYB2_FULL_42_35]|uniref:Uncharacterized protein n=1 Tax=candidate division WOR-1 bacterium RIFOXYC2_FULL_41_25 TaxID=1802586 RepID=A0A1F4TLA7_UNCSA|nr:MAG: hypothetical protein A2247_02785 [candidate division WOR-1 bacterium RIFOXYA2_FULL_41_14]OGC23043.1 MAG: hypothetical protein A2291_01150 [candidate division WOR-1 bacterium RIFOXYB2_FULL_42_35]OGC33501.1 MAG: hypothetical protein A2462_06930 [candidate division WOR-1 bacterium RIFOXYC2_FULL_41_25]OGC42608.1 MAG: hypothetical protein A2548_01820 [candidate division WOR-1 bacterium RIFOXYD2_FULL_41_8]
MSALVDFFSDIGSRLWSGSTSTISATGCGGKATGPSDDASKSETNQPLDSRGADKRVDLQIRDMRLDRGRDKIHFPDFPVPDKPRPDSGLPDKKNDQKIPDIKIPLDKTIPPDKNIPTEKTNPDLYNPCGPGTYTQYYMNAGAVGAFPGVPSGGIVYEKDGKTKVDGTDAGGKCGSTGALIQWIRVGNDGIKQPPDKTQPNYVSPNDVLHGSYRIGDDTATNMFTQLDGAFFNMLAGCYPGTNTSAAQFFVRVWNGTSPQTATHYGDSKLLTPSTSPLTPTPEYEIGNLTLNIPTP